jgi:hypothetical protein
MLIGDVHLSQQHHSHDERKQVHWQQSNQVVHYGGAVLNALAGSDCGTGVIPQTLSNASNDGALALSSSAKITVGRGPPVSRYWTR